MSVAYKGTDSPLAVATSLLKVGEILRAAAERRERAAVDGRLAALRERRVRRLGGARQQRVAHGVHEAGQREHDYVEAGEGGPQVVHPVPGVQCLRKRRAVGCVSLGRRGGTRREWRAHSRREG